MTESRGMLAGIPGDALRAKASTPPYDRLWRRLQRRTREVMAEARAGDFRTLSYGALAWHSLTPMVREAAALWLIDGDEDALCYVEQCITAVDGANRDPEAYGDLIGRRLEELAEKLGDGSVTSLLVQLVEGRHLSARDREALRRLLDEAEDLT